MERALTLERRSNLLTAARSIDGGAIGGWLLAVGGVIYLGARQGGFDTVVSSQVAIIAWWLILLLTAFGLARVRLTRAGRIGLGLLVGYAAWTALSLSWTDSAESTMTDVSQMLLYVALALLVLLVQRRIAVRYMLHGLATGIVAVTFIALLSRLHFQWFGIPQVDATLGSGATKRLSYPIDYWNALAALMAIGIPVLLYCATGARTLIARAAAAGALPMLALCAFLTASRGGILEIAVGLVVFFALAPERLGKVAVAAVAGAGSALLIAAANQRAEVRDGLRTTVAAHQGNELVAIAVAVMVGVGLLAAAAILVERHVARPRLLTVTRRQLAVFSAAAIVVVCAGLLAAGGGSYLSRKWTQFKSAGDVTTSSANAFSRLQSSSGEGRYQYWQVELHAANAKPLTGTGANTFQFLWLQRGNAADGYVVDAHSLYAQALGDLGYPGLLLIVGFVALILGAGVWRVIRSRDPEERLALSAATAGAFAFAFAAAIDWVWFIPLLPLTLFICAGVIFAPAQSKANEAVPRSSRTPSRRVVAARIAAGIACVAAIVVVALPMAATQAVRASQSQSGAGNVSAALADAHEAVSLQPYAAANWLQEGQVEEQAGDLQGALIDVRKAVALQPAYWWNWAVLSRLAARTGHAAAAIADYQHAYWLNPNNFPHV